MRYLFSNFNPVKTSCSTFIDTFDDYFIQSDGIDIAVGYVSADSVSELKKMAELNNIKHLNLTIGMHYFEKFTKPQYHAAMYLNDFLVDNDMGCVRLVNAFRFHGKMYSFSKSGKPFAGIIGSNNLSSIVDSQTRVYEASAVTENESETQQMLDFIKKLNSSSAIISDLDITEFNKNNPVLQDQDYVEEVDKADVLDCQNNLTEISFDIPIKATEKHGKSNLNVYFGKGRVDKRGLIKPRHWYEAELIVPSKITCQSGYPQASSDNAVFDVITDDGYKFKIKVSGDYSKNFRSADDLKILGKWLKGRLENEGALKVGQPVTESVLNAYGRTHFKLTKTKKDNLWYLDFNNNGGVI